MRTPAPAQGDGPREHVQSAPPGKPPASERAVGAPSGRGGGTAARPGSVRRLPLGSAAGLAPAPSRLCARGRCTEERSRRAPSGPPPARPRPPPASPAPPARAGAGPGQGAPRGPPTAVPEAPLRPRPGARPPCPARGARERAPNLSRAAPSGQGGRQQAAGWAAGRGAPGNGRPREPRAPLPAASPGRRVRGVPRPGQSAPATGPAGKGRCQNPREAQPAGVRQQAAATVPGRGREGGRAPPGASSAALQRGRAKACPMPPQDRGLPNRPLAVKRVPEVARGSRPRPSPGRRGSAARGAVGRHGRTRGAKEEKLPRTSQPQSRRSSSSGCLTLKAAAAGASRGGGASKSRQPATRTDREPKTPPQRAQDRRKQLEQWVISRGRSYKRPPMSLPAKKPQKVKEGLELLSQGGLEEENRRREQLTLTDKITSMLTECQKLAEEGAPSEELLAMLSRIPEAEKFAQFWICKAKLLARHGSCDVTRLYEAAVCAGAVPIQDLRDVVMDILKRASKTTQAVPAKASLFPNERWAEKSVQRDLKHPTYKPISAVKLQVVPLLRVKEPSLGPGVKLLTPVRRSLRIEHALARYPLMLKDHDPVVSSLDELMATEAESQFVFRPNGALPEDGAVALLGL